MSKKTKTILIACFALFSTFFSFAQSKNLVETAIGSPEHTTLVDLIKAANLVDVLKGDKPLTVFAPINSAFSALDDQAINFFTKTDQGKEILATIIKNHVVEGNVDAKSLIALIEKSKNKKASLTTLAGNKIYATLEEGKVVIRGGAGEASFVTTADVACSNGTIHMVSGMITEAWGR